MSGSSPLTCPDCGQPAQPEDRFCNRCAYPLRQSCRVCRQEAPIWARFCPSCGAVFALAGAQQEESTERQIVVGFGLPEGAPMPTVPGASAAPQVGAPGVPGASAMPQTGAPGVPGAPAMPQTGAPGVPTASAPPQSGAPTAPTGAQGGPPHLSSMPGGPHTGTVARMAGHAAGKTAGRSLGSKLLGTAAGKVITAVVAVAVVATSTFAIAAATGHNPLGSGSHKPSSSTGSGGAPSPTAPPPPPPEVTYVGSDGNIWDMTLPGGTPRQLTTDATPTNPGAGTRGVGYYALAWSPDGSMLAVVRSVGGENETGAQLRMLTPDGTVLWKKSMTLPHIDYALVWSPDGRLLAYRQDTQNFNGPNGDLVGKLVIVDARTGATTSAVDYDAGGWGCGGGGIPSLNGLISAAHRAWPGIDTFDWSPDGQQILVTFGCVSGESALVAVSNGATTPGYPAGASFQPGGHLILGLSTGGLELTDLTGKQVRVLMNGPAQQANSPYAEDLGLGTWTHSGKLIYYEYQDSIWCIGVDGADAKQIIAGTRISNGQATAEVTPKLSPDDRWLLYFQASGDAVDYNNPATGAWYVARANGAGAFALPRGASLEAIWRPGT